ncbi:MAG: phosphate acyltransferase [Terrimicrobiaceae bacterium]|nr:phosphate acyltransferase [Terrimicrobiaceae bacterium]
MKFIESVYAKLKRHPKRIVFPEGDDPRVLRAAQVFYEHQLGVPVLLGQREVIERVAMAEKVSLDHVAIINPETSSDLPIFCERLEKLDRYKNFGIRDSRAIMTNRNYFAAMMLQYGLVDGLVGGVSSYGGSLLRPLLQLVKRFPHADVIASAMIIELPHSKHGEEGVLFFSDCGVVPEPTMQQLGSIAVQTGLLARQVFGQMPRVAMLSFSTKGSARTPSTEKVAGATVIARELATKLGLEWAVDGELQADTALVPELAEIKQVGGLVAGRANVLIFPDLNSGNIAVKLVQHLGGAHVYGQILLGLTRPAAELSRGTHPDEIAAVAALVGLQAIEYRRLYPSDETPA